MKSVKQSILAGCLLIIGIITLSGGPGGAAVGTAAPGPTPVPHPTPLTAPVPDPHLPGVQWFAATGHTLRGPFLDYWTRNGGLAQFGYPLTEEFVEPIGGDDTPYRVQYFERNRFEYHPENKGTPYEVLLGVLGLEFRAADPPAPPPPAPRLYFPETGHSMTGEFLKYWQGHGGLAVQGYPITEPVTEKSPTDGKEYTVQWTERSRMESHPEFAGTPSEVELGLLGTQSVQKKGYSAGRYPAYGHGANYSWLSGYYRSDPRKCAVCGCSTVDFVGPTNTAYLNTRAVRPYGPEWDRALSSGLQATTEPQQLIVIFGQADDPALMEAAATPGSCRAPMYKVTGFTLNAGR